MPDFESVVRVKPIGVTDLIGVDSDVKDPVSIPLDHEQGIWSYLRGTWKNGGWWFFFPYAMAVKMPLGTFVLLLLAAVVTFLGLSKFRNNETVARKWSHCGVSRAS